MGRQQAMGAGRPLLRVVPAGEAPSDEAQALELERRLEPYKPLVRHKGREGIGDFYVGRPTFWGNRFRLPKGGGTDDERRLVVLQYAREMEERSEAQRQMMLSTIRRVLGEGSKLVCWCAPKLCHAQVLAYWAVNGRSPLAPIPGARS